MGETKNEDETRRKKTSNIADTGCTVEELFSVWISIPLHLHFIPFRLQTFALLYNRSFGFSPLLLVLFFLVNGKNKAKKKYWRPASIQFHTKRTHSLSHTHSLFHCLVCLYERYGAKIVSVTRFQIRSRHVSNCQPF